MSPEAERLQVDDRAGEREAAVELAGEVGAAAERARAGLGEQVQRLAEVAGPRVRRASCERLQHAGRASAAARAGGCPSRAGTRSRSRPRSG